MNFNPTKKYSNSNKIGVTHRKMLILNIRISHFFVQITRNIGQSSRNIPQTRFGFLKLVTRLPVIAASFLKLKAIFLKKGLFWEKKKRYGNVNALYLWCQHQYYINE